MLHFPGTGINDNLADKAWKLGVPVWRFGGASYEPLDPADIRST
jgi:hypothetical protein